MDNLRDPLSVTLVTESRLTSTDFNDLGFGNHFSDHMFSMEFENGAWRNPSIIPYGPIAMEPGTGALHYSQSVFEGLKAFRGSDDQIRVFRPDMNARRMARSCERLCIPVIDPALFIEAVRAIVRTDQDWIPGKRGQALYVRPIVFGVEPHLEVRPASRYRFLIMTSPVRTYYGDEITPVALHVQQHYTRASPGGVGEAKTGGNYAASLLPGERARDQGFNQALWLDGIEHKYVEEVGQMNIFFRFGDTVVTPALRGTILPGVTRDSVITLLRDQGFAVEERRLAVDEVLEGSRSGTLREVFGAGTAAVIAPVGRICLGGTTYEINNNEPGELTGALYNKITSIQYGETNDPHGWNMLVPAGKAAAAAE
ncbi:MAG: branched-chain amino acid aminotransferase [Gammaproteobacteria bacterium]|nr:branched-chain amino acid aminotransferase [Gammaproteobacteria bacterium]